VRDPHSPFSPDLAPSDFYLFGEVRTALMGAAFEGEDQLFQSVMDVVHRIPRDELEVVLTSGSLDWTHASSESEITANERNLPDVFLLFYLELIWPY
jgi:hypothetical protein